MASRKEFRYLTSPLDTHWQRAEKPTFLGIVTGYDGSPPTVTAKGNATDLMFLVRDALDFLLPEARKRAESCPCDRCRQNLDKMARAHAVLHQQIPADRN